MLHLHSFLLGCVDTEMQSRIYQIGFELDGKAVVTHFLRKRAGNACVQGTRHKAASPSFTILYVVLRFCLVESTVCGEISERDLE